MTLPRPIRPPCLKRGRSCAVRCGAAVSGAGMHHRQTGTRTSCSSRYRSPPSVRQLCHISGSGVPPGRLSRSPSRVCGRTCRISGQNARRFPKLFPLPSAFSVPLNLPRISVSYTLSSLLIYLIENTYLAIAPGDAVDQVVELPLDPGRDADNANPGSVLLPFLFLHLGGTLYLSIGL